MPILESRMTIRMQLLLLLHIQRMKYWPSPSARAFQVSVDGRRMQCRDCTGQITCTQLCTSKNLRNQDRETSESQWFAAAALHVYSNCPSSSPGTPSNPHIGLKVYLYGNVDSTGCGPNWCCCHVPDNF